MLFVEDESLLRHSTTAQATVLLAVVGQLRAGAVVTPFDIEC